MAAVASIPPILVIENFEPAAPARVTFYQTKLPSSATIKEASRGNAMKWVMTFLLISLVLWMGFRQLNSPGRLQERIGVPMAERVTKTDEEWQKELTPEQYQVARKKGTERAFTGAYWNSKDKGIFACVCCGQPLFDASTKFDSGTGWPSFWKPVDENHVSLLADNSLFMRRVEAVCSRCDAHLGHVFEDGPEPTGLRYCINSASLKLMKPE
jgi:peptide-methionine (R)-S-oxide reductase